MYIETFVHKTLCDVLLCPPCLQGEWLLGARPECSFEIVAWTCGPLGYTLSAEMCDPVAFRLWFMQPSQPPRFEHFLTLKRQSFRLWLSRPSPSKLTFCCPVRNTLGTWDLETGGLDWLISFFLYKLVFSLHHFCLGPRLSSSTGDWTQGRTHARQVFYS